MKKYLLLLLTLALLLDATQIHAQNAPISKKTLSDITQFENFVMSHSDVSGFYSDLLSSKAEKMGWANKFGWGFNEIKSIPWFIKNSQVFDGALLQDHRVQNGYIGLDGKIHFSVDITQPIPGKKYLVFDGVVWAKLDCANPQFDSDREPTSKSVMLQPAPNFSVVVNQTVTQPIEDKANTEDQKSFWKTRGGRWLKGSIIATGLGVTYLVLNETTDLFKKPPVVNNYYNTTTTTTTTTTNNNGDGTDGDGTDDGDVRPGG